MLKYMLDVNVAWQFRAIGIIRSYKYYSIFSIDETLWCAYKSHSSLYLALSQKLWELTRYPREWRTSLEASRHVSLFNPLTPAPAVNGRDERWPLFLLWRHDLWPKLASSILKFYWRKDLSNDTQIRVIGSVEPEIYTKMVRNSNLTDQLGSKLPANTRRYSMVKLACLDDAFLGWKQAQ